MLAQALPQIPRAIQFVIAERGGVPLRRFHVVDGNEGGFTSHGQAHVVFAQFRVHRASQCVDGGPLVVAVGLGDARIFMDAHDTVVEAEGDLAFIRGAGHRRRADRVRRACQRDMVFPGEQAGGGVEAKPAGARHVDLGPGVQIGEIGFRAGRAVKRFQVGGELHQVAGNEAGGKAEMAQEPRPRASVSSQVCTPGSMRMLYCRAFQTY